MDRIHTHTSSALRTAERIGARSLAVALQVPLITAQAAARIISTIRELRGESLNFIRDMEVVARATPSATAELTLLYAGTALDALRLAESANTRVANVVETAQAALFEIARNPNR